MMIIDTGHPAPKKERVKIMDRKSDLPGLPPGVYVTWCQRCGKTLELTTRDMYAIRARGEPTLCSDCHTRYQLIKSGGIKE